MRYFIKCLILLAPLSYGSAATANCSPEALLRGNVQAFETTKEWDGETYSTYIVRNADRDREGVLRDAIRYEISPARWGFDINSTVDELIATISEEHVEDGGPGYSEWVIYPSVNLETACAGRRFTLRVESRNRATVFMNGSVIGTIANFPFHEAF